MPPTFGGSVGSIVFRWEECRLETFSPLQVHLSNTYSHLRISLLHKRHDFSLVVCRGTGLCVEDFPTSSTISKAAYTIETAARSYHATVFEGSQCWWQPVT